MQSENQEKKLLETEVVVVLDRSGSMGSIGKATVDGFNEFMKEQKGAEGKAFVTLVQFDDQYEIDYKSRPVEEVADLILNETFVPRGLTALYDALGKTIEELNTERDVVFVIITDGAENASKTYTRPAIFKMIESQTAEKGWKFLFLAANQDAIGAGASIGISASNSMNYSATFNGATASFASVSNNISGYRGSKEKLLSKIRTAGVSKDEFDADYKFAASTLDFTDRQREESTK